MTSVDPNRAAIDMIVNLSRQIVNRASHGDCDYARDSESLLKRIKQLESLNAVREKGLLMMYLAVVEIMTARYTQALERMIQARKLFQTLPDATRDELSALNNIGELFRLIGDYERAAERFNEGIQIAHATGTATTDPNVSIMYTNLGLANMMLKRLPEAEAAFGVAQDMYKAATHQHRLSIIETWRGVAEVRLLAGNLQGAWNAVRLALELAQGKDIYFQGSQALLTASHVAAKDPASTTLAEAYVQSAIETSSKIGATSVQATIWLEEAYYQRTYGTSEAVNRFANMARAIYEQHGMVEGIAIAGRI